MEAKTYIRIHRHTHRHSYRTNHTSPSAHTYIHTHTYTTSNLACIRVCACVLLLWIVGGTHLLITGDHSHRNESVPDCRRRWSSLPPSPSSSSSSLLLIFHLSLSYFHTSAYYDYNTTYSYCSCILSHRSHNTTILSNGIYISRFVHLLYVDNPTLLNNNCWYVYNLPLSSDRSNFEIHSRTFARIEIILQYHFFIIISSTCLVNVVRQIHITLYSFVVVVVV